MTHTEFEPGKGDGPPLILVHGVGLDHTMWDLVVPALLGDPAGPSQVIRYDLLGHGKTAAAKNKLTMIDLVEQLQTVAAGLAPDPSSDGSSAARPDVAGLSLGGAIVRGAAARNPNRFGRTIIANTVFARGDEQRRANRQRLQVAQEEGMGAVADLAVDRWFTRSWQQAHPELVAAVHRRLSNTDLSGYLEAYRVFVEGDPAMPGQLSTLTNKTLFVTGDRDSGSTPAMTHAMANIAPNATAHILPDTGHLPPIEHPETFSRLVIDFLEKPNP